jgi:hypothetical protein
VARPHDELKGTVAEPRVFICTAGSRKICGTRKDQSPFARTDQRVGMYNITACRMEVRPEPIEIAENACIARLGTSARPHPR